jgi:aspartate aminotransferase-like enzyme
MASLLNTVDPEGLLEYSVVFSDRSLNHMSEKFQTVMCDISSLLKEVYNADAVAIVPGGGTYGMEAVCRQFAVDQEVLVIRNGWFSYRWSQILENGNFAKKITIMKANQIENHIHAPFSPPRIDEVVNKIHELKPKIVFAPHVETSAGVILPDSYLKTISEEAHSVGALVVLDCVASGCAWIDMKKTGVDILISAPQKGWSSTPSSGLVMMSNLATNVLQNTTSNSFAIDLKKWYTIMQTYENGGHAYHTTMPTDSLSGFRDTMLESKNYGFKKLYDNQWLLGNGIRKLLAQKSIKSVAPQGFCAPGVVVSYTNDKEIQSGKKFKDHGMQIAAGVPLQCDESKSFSTFRIGLFGLDKLKNVNASLSKFSTVLDKVF